MLGPARPAGGEPPGHVPDHLRRRQALLKPVRWYEVIPAALHGIPAGRVRVDLPPNMPEIEADAGMLERVIANIVENAVKYAPDSDIVLVGTAGGLSTATLAGRARG